MRDYGEQAIEASSTALGGRNKRVDVGWLQLLDRWLWSARGTLGLEALPQARRRPQLAGEPPPRHHSASPLYLREAPRAATRVFPIPTTWA